MAGKSSKAAPSEADTTASQMSSAPDTSNLNVDESTAAPKTEEAATSAGDAEGSTAQAEAAESAFNPPADAAQDDAASRGSSESDDKTITSSPSKKSSSKSKKGGNRSSRGKSTGSKRSSEEQEAAKDDVDADSQNVDQPSATSTANEPGAEAGTAHAGEAQAASSSAPDAEDSTEASNAHRNGRDDAKSGPASKELAQLGLGSFGDGADDEVIGPRRSRRGPGASPDPKARVPKSEPDTDATALQDPASNDNTEPVASNDAIVSETDATTTAQAADESKDDVEASAVPEEEVADEALPKAETDDGRDLKPQTETAEEPNLSHGSNTHDNGDEGEADYGDADDQDDLDGEEGGDEGVTRCVCGSADENVGLMIQCETCKCWQHCVCMGMQVEEDCPDVYFCEQCRPELHIPLLRSLGLLPKSTKKGSGKHAKYSARELKEAKEAIAMLAQENARRAQAAEAAAAYGSRDRKGSANSRTDNSKEAPPKSPKRRSTMNSRDSAYGGWEPIPPGLLADGETWDGVEDRKGGKKRKRGQPDDAGDSAAEAHEAGEGSADSSSDASKRRRMSAGPGQSADQDADAEMEEDDVSGATDHSTSASREKSHKKKKGNNQYTVREASVTADSSASKPRHPNQYTYRNKDRNGVTAPNGQKTGSSSTSNLTSHSPSPSPSKGRAEHARRAAARDNGSQLGTPAPAESSGASGRTSTVQWGLPEHLSHLTYLLPGSGSLPGPNASKSPGQAAEEGPTNGNSFAGKKGSTSSGETSSGPSPPASASFPTPFQVVSSIESSTKVRFPSRRMTLGEMRKRVRNIGEYVTRSQIEAVEREKRMKLLGIVPPYMEEMEEEDIAEAEATRDDVKNADAAAGGATEEQNAGEIDGAQAQVMQSKAESLPLSMRLMEELTRELIHFQRKFGIGPGNFGSSHQSASVS